MERTALIVGGLAIGLLIAVGAFVLLEDDEGGQLSSERRPVDELDFPAIDHDAAASGDLVEAWERWRRATFVTSGTFSRTLDVGGEPLVGPSYRAQDPPRRLVVRLGTTVERIDGVVSVCDADDDGFDAPDCVGGGATMDYEERVDAELRLVEAYVEGVDRLYDVAGGDVDGCYRAEIRVADLRSPWGRWAEFCFDEATGALVSSRVRRPSAVDVEDLRVVSATVDDTDFEPGA